MLRRIIATSGTWATVPLRLVLGAVFIGHGAQKLFGVFGGPGPAKWTSSPPPLAFMQSAGKYWMGAAVFAELLGGVLVLLGLLTRVGALLILGTMVVAIVGVHWTGGFFAPEGIEYPMTLAGICLALLVTGGGQVSADMALSKRRR
jgi:putative oxidoreductase